MGINITSGPSDTAVIDVTPDPFPWRKFIILLLALLALAGLFIFLLVTLLPHSGSGGHGSFGGIGALAMIPVIIASQSRVKKITLSPDAIEIIRASAKLSVTIPISQIVSCTMKKNWTSSGWYKFTSTSGKKVTIAATKELFPLLKIELQKRYSFPII